MRLIDPTHFGLNRGTREGKRLSHGLKGLVRPKSGTALGRIIKAMGLSQTKAKSVGLTSRQEWDRVLLSNKG